MEPTHTPDIDFGEHAHDLEEGDLLWSPVTTEVAAELPVTAGAVVADVGCGTGGMSLLLARRVGTVGRVLAVDREPALLRRVRERAEAAGLGHRVVTVQATVDDLPAALVEVAGPVTLVWAGHVVHHSGDQAAAVRKLAEALRPGGVLAIAEGGPPPKRLPHDVGIGRPGLELRLEVATTDWFTAMRADLPGSVRDPRGWPALVRAAGLVDVSSRGWLLHRPAPLPEPLLATVLHGLVSRVERATPWLDPDDVASWKRLLDPMSPDWLGSHRRRGDLEMIAVELVHLGRRPSAG